jgi:uncharacterized membrane protein
MVLETDAPEVGAVRDTVGGIISRAKVVATCEADRPEAFPEASNASTL